MNKPWIALLPFLFMVAGMAGLAACLPIATPPPVPTDTPVPPTATVTPTTTPVWFPPTSTPTPIIAATVPVSPTEDVSPQYGALILTDDFEEGDAWTLGRTNAGGAALSKSELTLAISQKRGYVSSVRSQPILTDFYVEITASPSICRDDDVYGLLLRTSTSEDAYRFGLTCSGQVLLDRVINGNASHLIAPVYSGDVPPGAPSMSRLAVWALERELRFYVNGQFQFRVRDTYLKSGSLGIFAQAAGEDAVTVNFSELEVYETVPGSGMAAEPAPTEPVP